MEENIGTANTAGSLIEDLKGIIIEAVQRTLRLLSGTAASMNLHRETISEIFAFFTTRKRIRL